MCFHCTPKGDNSDLWTVARYICTAEAAGDGKHVGSARLQQLYCLVDFGKGDASFCLGAVRNADDLLPTAAITSAETSVVIVWCPSCFSSSFFFFNIYFPSVPYSLSRFFSISLFPSSLLSPLLTSFSQSTFQHYLPSSLPLPLPF